MDFSLTPEQRTILDHDPTRHARLLAGPGTGKSTTMVELLDRFLKEDASLRVKMLTFTRAATAELAEKTAHRSEELAAPSTIHSFAISILLLNPGTAGFPEPLRIADSWESKKVVRPSLARRAGFTVPRLRKLEQEMASNWESLTDEKDDEISEEERIRFLGAWNEHRRVLGYTLLAELPNALRAALKNHDDLDGIKFDLLLVDEYQDLNACDLELLKLLSEKGGCSVIGTGDDDQSIYSFRKAEPEGIRRFLKDYASAKDYTLSVTLRCGKLIIEWANDVILGDLDRPRGRAVLSPHPDSPDGERALLRFPGDKTEAKGIAKLVQGLVQKKGLEPKDVLILMRTDHNRTFSSRIREELEKLGIQSSDPNYVLALMDCKRNRKVLEALRLLAEPEDSISWASLLHLTRGVGPTFFEYVYDVAKANGTTFARELLSLYDKGFPDAPSSARMVKPIIKTILGWLEENELPTNRPDAGWGSWIIELNRDGKVISGPTDDFAQLLRDLDDVTEAEYSLGRYIGQIEPLGKDLATAKNEGVRLMTMSGSKGLTARATIIAGLEDGLVPRPNSDLREERRILYVAMTRAKEYLFCTWAKRRRGPTMRAGAGGATRRRPSCFLQDGPVDSEDGDLFIKDWIKK